MSVLPGIAIFGLNSVSKFAFKVFLNHGFKIVGLWDNQIVELRDYAEKFNIAIYSTEEDKVLVNKDVEMVCIFCQPHLHSQIAAKALSIGKHVICMPPSGLDSIDAQKMVVGAQYYPSLISIMAYSLRYLPSIIQMRKLIEEHALGQILSCEYIIHKSMHFTPPPEKEDINSYQDSSHDQYDKLLGQLRGPDAPNLNVSKDYWISDPWMGGGILNLIGIHAIDLLNFLINDKITRLHSEVACIKSSITNLPYLDVGRCFDDYITINAFYPTQKIRAFFLINGSLPPNLDKEELVINGSAASLHFDGLNFTLYQNSPNSNLTLKSEVNLKMDLINKDLNQSFSYLPNSFLQSFNHLIGAVKESFTSCSAGHWAKRSLGSAATFEDGLHLCNIVNAIRQSSRSRTWITTDVMRDASVEIVDDSIRFKDNPLLELNEVDSANTLLLNNMAPKNTLAPQQQQHNRPRPISYAGGHPPLTSYHSVGSNQAASMFFTQI